MCDCVDTMDQWDEDKLRSVVLSKAGNPRTTTDVRFTAQRPPPMMLLIVIYSLLDRLQILHRSHRIPEIRLVLGMSKRRFMPIPPRPPTRLRTQISEESCGGGCQGQCDQLGRILGGRGGYNEFRQFFIYIHTPFRPTVVLLR